MLESVLVPSYSEIPEPSPTMPLYRSNNWTTGSEACACRRGGSNTGSSAMFAAEQRALATRLREVADREAAAAAGGETYKAVYRPTANAESNG